MAGASGNPKNPSWYSGGLSGALAPGAGNIYYVNGGSDGPVVDTGSGLTADDPKQLIQSAIDLCTANNNDYVIVLNYGANGRAAETWPIVVDKTLCHIIGVGSPSQKWPVVRPNAPAGADTASPAFSVTADRVEIAGFELGGGDTAGAIHPVDAGGVWGLCVHDCFFGVTGDSAGQDGIRVPAASAAPYLTVYGCRFGHYLTRDGVRFDANATRCMIGVPGQAPNIFHNVPGICINDALGITEPGIFDNLMALPSDTAGKAITLAAGAVDGWVSGNSAQFGSFADMANNPYADAAGADANHWWNNIKGNAAQTWPA